MGKSREECHEYGAIGWMRTNVTATGVIVDDERLVRTGF